MPKSRTRTNELKKMLRKFACPIIGIALFLFFGANTIPNLSAKISEHENYSSDLPTTVQDTNPADTKIPITTQKETSTDSVYDLNEAQNEEKQMNAQEMSQWLTKYANFCEEKSTAAELVSFVSDSLLDATEKRADPPARGIKRCKNVFMDFGSNIGDSVAKFIESELQSCTKDNEGVRYDVVNRVFYAGEYNNISKKFKASIDKTKLHPSDFCVYGVEGNPHFTKQLQEMEDQLMSMVPRPVQNVHFLTEHVASDKDGPTTMYLDTVNEKENFWGSSTIESHQDVQKSVREVGDGVVSSAPVTGITLTTLMRQTLLPFSKNASDEEKAGGHLVVKVDIEGGEYAFMEEAAMSNLLCEYRSMGNTVDLIVEYHVMSITDSNVRNPLLKKKGATKAKLEDCGVQMNQMSAMWY